MNDIIIFSIPEGDWQAMYVNEELMHEAHSIEIIELKHFVPIRSIQEVYISNFDSDEDSFPKFFKDFNSNWKIDW